MKRRQGTSASIANSLEFRVFCLFSRGGSRCGACTWVGTIHVLSGGCGVDGLAPLPMVADQNFLAEGRDPTSWLVEVLLRKDRTYIVHGPSTDIVRAETCLNDTVVPDSCTALSRADDETKKNRRASGIKMKSRDRVHHLPLFPRRQAHVMACSMDG